jgi:hypothetical protein
MGLTQLELHQNASGPKRIPHLQGRVLEREAVRRERAAKSMHLGLVLECLGLQLLAS